MILRGHILCIMYLNVPISSAIDSLKETSGLIIQPLFIAKHTGVTNKHKKVVV